MLTLDADSICDTRPPTDLYEAIAQTGLGWNCPARDTDSGLALTDPVEAGPVSFVRHSRSLLVRCAQSIRALTCFLWTNHIGVVQSTASSTGAFPLVVTSRSDEV